MAAVRKKEKRTHLEYLEDLSEADVAALETRWLVCDLDLLVSDMLTKYARLKTAENELQATERLIRLALKHEDGGVAPPLSHEAAYLREVIPMYHTWWSQSYTQWRRLWSELQARAEGAPERKG